MQCWVLILGIKPFSVDFRDERYLSVDFRDEVLSVYFRGELSVALGDEMCFKCDFRGKIYV